jgi:hypothetical protein
MKYQEARTGIWTGDLIAIKRRTGALAVGTRLVTRSPYTHTGIAVWTGPPDDRRLLLAQANAGGGNLVPLSQHAIYSFDVFNCPVRRIEVEKHIWLHLESRIEYGFDDLARIAAHLWLGVPLPDADDGGLVCSSLSARIYQAAGWQPNFLPSIPWPGAVVDAVGGKPVFEIEP